MSKLRVILGTMEFGSRRLASDESVWICRKQLQFVKFNIAIMFAWVFEGFRSFERVFRKRIQRNWHGIHVSIRSCRLREAKLRLFRLISPNYILRLPRRYGGGKSEECIGRYPNSSNVCYKATLMTCLLHWLAAWFLNIVCCGDEGKSGWT